MTAKFPSQEGNFASCPELVKLVRNTKGAFTMQNNVTTKINKKWICLATTTAIALSIIAMPMATMAKELTNEAENKIQRSEVQRTASEKITEVTIPDEVLRAYIKTELNIGENDPITTENIQGLKRIDLESKSVKSMQGLEHAVNLESINLSHNQITAIPSLANLDKLILIDLTDNELMYVAGLRGASALAFAFLSDNQIHEVSRLAELPDGMWILDLSNNQIKDANPVAKLDAIQINLDNNHVSDFSAFQMSGAHANNQTVTLPTVALSGGIFDLGVTNPIIGYSADTPIVRPTTISDGGSYNAAQNKVSWTGLNHAIGTVQYTWNGGGFSGTVSQPYTNADATTGTVAPDDFILGTSKYLEGTYTGDVAKVKLTVNGETYNGGTVADGKISIYAYGKIKTTEDDVTVTAYDKYGNPLDTQTVQVKSNIGSGTVTPDAYTVGTSKYVTGTYTGDVVKMELDVDGTIYKGGTVADGKINFYAHGKIKADSKSVNVLVYDAKGNQLDKKPVMLNK